ncbi:MAG: hypothetical protein ABIG44_01520, partial [Planctomycetota bacterium]
MRARKHTSAGWVTFTIVLFWSILLISGCQSSIPRGTTGQYDQGAIIRGDTTIPHIALIFTGGEHGEGTEFILDTLKAKNIPAAFF